MRYPTSCPVACSSSATPMVRTKLPSYAAARVVDGALRRVHHVVVREGQGRGRSQRREITEIGRKPRHQRPQSVDGRLREKQHRHRDDHGRGESETGQPPPDLVNGARQRTDATKTTRTPVQPRATVGPRMPAKVTANPTAAVTETATTGWPEHSVPNSIAPAHAATNTS